MTVNDSSSAEDQVSVLWRFLGNPHNPVLLKSSRTLTMITFPTTCFLSTKEVRREDSTTSTNNEINSQAPQRERKRQTHARRHVNNHPITPMKHLSGIFPGNIQQGVLYNPVLHWSIQPSSRGFRWHTLLHQSQLGSSVRSGG